YVRLRAAEKQGGGDALAGPAGREILDDVDAAGKRGALELDLEAGLVAGDFLAVEAAAQHGVTHGHGDMQVGGETVGGIAADGEPARRVHEVSEVGMDGGEPDAVDGGIFLPGELAVVVEGDGDGLALDERLLKTEADGEILLVAGGRNLLARAIHHARHRSEEHTSE